MGRARFLSVVLSVLLPAGCFLYGADDPQVDAPERETPDANEDAATDTATNDAFDGSAAVDAATTCAPKAPFTNVAPVTEVNTPDDETYAHLSTDELTLYLSRGNFVAVYTRAARADPFKGGAGLDVNAGNSTNVRVTDDTLRTYFAAYLGGGINTTRMVSKSRPTTTSIWTDQPNRVLQLGAADGVAEVDPFPLMADEKSLYFASERSGSFTLWVTRKVSDQWEPPLELKGISTGAGDRKPVVAADESFLYFQSARPPGKTGEGLIWIAIKQAANDTFGDVAFAPGINAPAGSDSFPVWFSNDRCRLYFISNRTGGKGQHDLWMATRTP